MESVPSSLGGGRGAGRPPVVDSEADTSSDSESSSNSESSSDGGGLRWQENESSSDSDKNSDDDVVAPDADDPFRQDARVGEKKAGPRSKAAGKKRKRPSEDGGAASKQKKQWRKQLKAKRKREERKRNELAEKKEKRQAKLKNKLRIALAEKYYPDCWTRVIPCREKAPTAYVAQNGLTMRLTAVNGRFYSFIGMERVASDKHPDKHPFGVPDYYLLHESEFSVTTKDHWNNQDLEAGWFMYERTEEEIEWEKSFNVTSTR